MTQMRPDDFAAWRVALGLSQAAAAQLLGKAPRTVQRYEAGDSRVPRSIEYLMDRISVESTAS